MTTQAMMTVMAMTASTVMHPRMANAWSTRGRGVASGTRAGSGMVTLRGGGKVGMAFPAGAAGRCMGNGAGPDDGRGGGGGTGSGAAGRVGAAELVVSPVDLSSRVGLDVDTVKGAVQRLRDQGYLRIVGERVDIPDLDALRRLYALLGSKEELRGDWRETDR